MLIPFFIIMINLNSDLKFKYLSEQDLIISLDRLTRFKNPEIKYRRVFYDIILRHLTFPSVSKHKLDEISASDVKSCVETIWNQSVQKLYPSEAEKFSTKDLDDIKFEITDDYTKTLMSANLSIAPIIVHSKQDNFPLNLKFLKIFYNNYSKNDYIQSIANKIRKDEKTLFPVQKLILTEGITEEILLPKFAEVFGFDFNENGIYILATGGKSKVLSIYAELKYILKIPVFVLLDNDAEPVYNDVCSVLRDCDKAYLIKSGEFEDILPKNLIKKAFVEMNYDTNPPTDEELQSDIKTCKTLEDMCKSRGLGEFRKAHFAKAVHDCLNDKSYITEEVDTILTTIKNL